MGDEFFSIAQPCSNYRRGASHPEEKKPDSSHNSKEEAYDSEPEVPAPPLQRENRIAALAKPRKSCLSVPARLNTKKKVVAFGHTTNLSQTVEGTSARNTKPKPFAQQKAKALSSSPNMNDKENIVYKARTAELKLPTVLREMPPQTPLAGKVATGKGDPDAYTEILRQMFAEQERKLSERDEKSEKQINQLRQEMQDRLQIVEARLTTSRPAISSNATSRRNEELRPATLTTQTPATPSEKLQDAFDAIELEVEKDPNALAFVRSWYAALTTKCRPGPVQLGRENPRVYQTGDEGTITEKLTMERTRSLKPQYSSPSSQPFSIETENFLNRSGLRTSNSKPGRSPMLESVRLTGQGRGYRDRRVPVHQLDEEAYDSYARARERNLPVYEQNDSFYEENFEDGLSAENNQPVVTEPQDDRRKMFEERARRNNPRL